MDDKDNNILNKSAIANWSGYIYQGLCGLYHSLTMIKAGVNPSEYKLWLDAYEDFSIERSGLMVSLHQCKCDTYGTNAYHEEFRKIRLKKNHLNSCLSSDCVLYFHSNHDYKVDEHIQKYQYPNGKSFCSPTEIIELIINVIGEILQSRHHYSNKDLIAASLIAMVDKKVLEVHERYLKGRKKKSLMWIAKRYADISFQDIDCILRHELILIDFNSDDIFQLWKITFITNINEIIENNDEIDSSKIDDLVECIESMDDNELKVFFQRINPDVRILHNSLSFVNNTNKDRTDALINIINDLIPMNKKLLCWNCNNKYETPTAITFKRSNIKRYCKEIVNNSANLDSIWIYDWMVGDGEFEKVDNIYSQVSSIMNLPDTDGDSKNIFKSKPVGILTIKDMQDGRFN